ncbi:unnamed protein product [Triticum aestivum]|uniref:VWFA domain-containing protein n=1 Tax=Triticum aestivum TaxID=4565 RepID=A0A7H4LAF9_WHEAT|nr:E3 ubiquitin-protein ligase WAVH1 [Aegilops tauschii subsp. strangulata]SPT15597.1 unnamed protein product [Triticum aestivum]
MNNEDEPRKQRTLSVQLAFKHCKRAPLKECKIKVMLELTGGDSTSDRPGLDLVLVMDVSGSMEGEKLDQVKTAMRFVVQKLSPIDRLSIVTFSNIATKLCPLQQVTEASQRQLQQLIDSLVAQGATNIIDGLRTGANILTDRKVSDGRVASIMLMSDGHVQDTGGAGLIMAVAQCLAGLLTVAIEELELKMEWVIGELHIVKVNSGNLKSYGGKGHERVSFGNLYSREVRRVIVELLLPAIDSERSTEIEVTLVRYPSKTGRPEFISMPPKTMSVWRTSMEVFEEEMPPELLMEEARLHAVEMLHQAMYLAEDMRDLGSAKALLVEAQNRERCIPELRTELQGIIDLLEAPESYAKHGQPYTASSSISHRLERYAARGNMETMRLFATPRIDEYLEQAKKFHDDPTIPLPSTDDDVQQEVGVLNINVASRAEEMRRLSLEIMV